MRTRVAYVSHVLVPEAVLNGLDQQQEAFAGGLLEARAL